MCRLGNQNPNWKGGLVEVHCDNCQKTKLVKRKELKLNHHFCDRRCHGDWLSRTKKGKNNYFFGGVMSKEARCKLSLSHGGTGIPYENRKYDKSIFNEKLKEYIRKRDNYTCQNCNMTEEEHLIVFGSVLHVHHIDYNKMNCRESNLISTCKSCNTRANHNKSYWLAFYKSKMEAIL